MVGRIWNLGFESVSAVVDLGRAIVELEDFDVGILTR